MKYIEQVKYDIKEWIKKKNVNPMDEFFKDDYDFGKYLYDNLCDEDSITGGRNHDESKGYILNDIETVVESVRDYRAEKVTEKFLRGDYSWFDMITRIHVFDKVVYEVAKEIFRERGK